MRNIGPISARCLRAVGVESRDDLDNIGAVEAFYRVRDAAFGPSLNLRYALQGALLGAHCNELPEAMKAQLKAQAEPSCHADTV